jgi:hypothetical protein
MILTVTINAQTGEEIFDKNCITCHIKKSSTVMEQRGTDAHRKAMMELKAPPIMKVVMKVKMVHQSKEEFVTFVADYIENPSKNKTLCNSRAVSHFGLMPAIGKSMTPEARKKVSVWIYDNFSSQKVCNTCTSCQGKSESKSQKKQMKCAAGKCGSK